VEAVARELLRRDIIPDVAGLRALGQQVSDDVSEVLLRLGDALTSMQERREFGGVVPAVVGDEGVGFQHGFEPLTSVADLVPQFGEVFEVAGDLTFVPGEQDLLYSVARPMPAFSAIRDIVTDVSPYSATSAAVVPRIASRTARRCSSIVSFHSFGTTQVYMTTVSRHYGLTTTYCLDKLLPS
jgi:hypothetical protein